jgi:hypothetical protein
VGSRICERRLFRIPCRIARAGGIALLWVCALVPDGFAQAPDTRWTTETTSLFADYRFSTDGRHTDHANLGGLFKYGWKKWDSTSYLFVNKSPRSSDTWLYAQRIRYRIADKHKIGIEAYGSLEKAGSPQLMLGYYGDVSDSVSLNLALGPVTQSGPDFSARLELIWQFR